MSDVAYKPRYRVSDYRCWDGDWELWDGVAVSMSPSPNPSHQALAGKLHVQLARALAESDGCSDCHLFYEIDWYVDDFTVVRPDLLIVCGGFPEESVVTPPSFIAEVLSPSTAEKDRSAKRQLYEQEGVRSYLMLDPDSGEAELLALDQDGTYAPGDPTRPIPLHPGCAIRLDFAALQ